MSSAANAVMPPNAPIAIDSGSMARSAFATCTDVIEVTLTDGTHLNERVNAVRGTTDNPMTREEVVAKCRDLITPFLGSTTCSRLIETVFELENAKDIRVLRPLLQRT